jgi:hypothetical protein
MDEDNDDPVEKWVQELLAERPEWMREEGRRRDEEAMAKADALWKATGAFEGLNEEEWIRVLGVVCPEEMREALLRVAAEALPESRAQILAVARKMWGH